MRKLALDDDILLNIEKPARYIGGEVTAVMKEKELEESKQEAEKAKKYNTKMLIIALVSAGIALASLVATILIAVL